MKHIKSTLTVIVATSLLFGCGEDGLTNEQGGTLLGAAIGGAAASNVGDGKGQTAAIIGGTLVGATVGQKVGKSVDATENQ